MTDLQEQGLGRMARCLGRAWNATAMRGHDREDATSQVLVDMIALLGREGFESLLGGVGRSGIPAALPWSAPLGREFARAIDRAKKRFRRRKRHASFEGREVASRDAGSAGPSASMALAIDALSGRLNGREDDLLRAMLLGESPEDYSRRRGLSFGTVYNARTRLKRKVLAALAAP